HIALPFEWLFARLEAAGFAMDTARKFRLLQLLDAKASEYVGRLDELKYLIAPFIAQNDKQQARFYEIFEAFLAECEEEALPEFIPPDSFWKRNKILLLSTGLVLITILILALWFGRRPEPEVAVPVKVEQLKGLSYSVSDTLTFTNQTIQQPGDSGKFIWEVLDPTTKQVLYSSTDQQLEWLPDSTGKKIIRLRVVEPDTTRFAPGEATTTVSIICDEPPVVNRADISPAEGGSMVQGSLQAFELRKLALGDSAIWIFSNGDTLRGASVSHQLSESASQTTVRLQVKRGEFCLTEVVLNYSLGKDKPFLSLLPLKELEPPISHRLNFWYWWLILLPLVALPWLYRRWSRQFRKEEVVVEKSLAELNEQYPVQDRDPYSIPYRDHRDQIQVPPLFFRIADVLRRREDGSRTEFDSKKSVAATVKAGGFPSWHDRNLSRPTAYLVLIEWHEERHQQDRLLQRLVSFLQEQDAPVTVLWHDGSFEQVWESNGEATDLGQWKRNHPAHRLIILGDAAGLQNRGMTPEPMLIQRRLSTLLAWERRLILTTRPASDWGWQEALLHEHFLLYPVNSQGILDGVEALDRIEEYTAGDVSLAFREAKRQYPEVSVQYEQLDTLEGLQSWLQDDPDLYRWLCGLAVTANPDWSLTVAIGRALGIDVTHDRLLRLSRIPWLASNQPHNGLRIDLLRALGAEDTVIARQTMIEELQAVKEQVAGGFAEVEWTATMAVQRFALDPALPAHKQQIRELQAVGILPMEQEAELEFIVREQTEGTGFSEEARTSLKAWLEAPELPQPIRWWTRESMLAILLVLVSTIGIVYGISFNQSERLGESSHPLHETITQADSATILTNEAIRISMSRDSLESWSMWENQEDSLRRAVDLLALAATYRANDPASNQLDSINGLVRPDRSIDSALFAILYNYKVKAFNFFLADSADLMTDLRDLNIGGDTIFRMQVPGNAPFYLHSQHLRGLSNYYLSAAQQNEQAAANLMDSAQGCYDRIVGYDGGYFDSLRQAGMVVNLETLLAAVPVDTTLAGKVLEQIEALLGRVQQRLADALNQYLELKQADALLRRSGLRELYPARHEELRNRADQLMDDLNTRLAISGTVTDRGGKPLPGVVVGYWDGNATTDADGAFSMEIYPEDRWDETVALMLLGGGAERKDSTVTIQTLIIGRPIHIMMSVAEDGPAVTEPADLYPLLDEAIKLERCNTLDSLIRILEQRGADKLAFYRGQQQELCSTEEPFLPPTMISIPGGSFTMGDVMGDREYDSELPLH
ncbi:MAG: carboxypeptidase-like regulatory domain-containing protein, partial [Bacteroidia bacterium]|nr:carboxypeptidase-like regulatory domain-containing protein [Bacteroidia bacterium]